MATIREIREAAARVQENFRAGVVRLLCLGRLADRRHRAQLPRGAVGGVPGERGHRQGQLVEQVDEFAVGGKLEVTRTAAAHRRREAVARDRRHTRIDLVDHDSVEPQIRHEGKASVGREPGIVRVRRVLPLVDDLGAAFMLDHLRRPELARGIEWEQGHGAAAVLGGEEKLSRRMHRDVSRAAVARGQLVDQLQGTVRPDPIRRRARAAGKRGDGVELLSVGVQREKAGRTDFRRHHRGRQLARRGVERRSVDALGPLPARAEKNVRNIRRERGDETGHEKQKQQGAHGGFHGSATLDAPNVRAKADRRGWVDG